MVVQHNLSAMNSNRMLGVTQKTLASSTEKLSSGYKINRAADDAAGLSISEKMRKQIRGLNQASANAEDGISAVQTAEGALQEVTDMLQRMNQLAVQAANGTNSESDRSYIQDEVNQLVTEIDRVAETTKFNETYLLKGDDSVSKGYSFGYKKWTKTNSSVAAATMVDDAATQIKAQVTFQTIEAGKVSGTEQNELANSLKKLGITVTASYVTNATKAYSLQLNGDAASKFEVAATATPGTFDIRDVDGNIIAKIALSNSNAQAGEKQTATLVASDVTAAVDKNEVAAYYDKDGNKISANALENYFTGSGTNTATARADAKTVYDAVGNVTTLDGGNITAARDKTGALGLSFHVGADGTGTNKININIEAMSAKNLGINGLRVNGDTPDKATAAIATIAEAVQKVSTQRSALGAVQNRLEHTIKNLDNIAENTTAAESQIRDTDMAAEMVKYSNVNILAQAGQSMLAQANQANQGVLSLIG